MSSLLQPSQKKTVELIEDQVSFDEIMKLEEELKALKAEENKYLDQAISKRTEKDQVREIQRLIEQEEKIASDKVAQEQAIRKKCLEKLTKITINDLTSDINEKLDQDPNFSLQKIEEKALATFADYKTKQLEKLTKI